MKKISLIDCDGHNFPNLPLMKISTYHKKKGDIVDFYNPLLGYVDIIYMSKVFDFTSDYLYPLYSDEVHKGGTGYDLVNKLDREVESQFPDYELYNITDTAYGFLTRGCPRKCDFCIVSKKEGCKSYQVSELEGFWNGQKFIKLLDPNLLACKDHLKLLEQLSESKAWIDFTQGLDIRLTNEENTNAIMQCKIKTVHFAWDKENDSSVIIQKLKDFKKQTNINDQKATVYVLTNFDTPFEFDIERIYILRELGYMPYIMIFDKQNAQKKYKKLQRWVNNKLIFKSCEKFEDYRD